MHQLEKVLLLFLFLLCFSVAAIPLRLMVIPLRLALIAVSLFYAIRFWSKGFGLIMTGLIAVMLGVFFKLMHWPMANGMLVLGSIGCAVAGTIILVNSAMSKTSNYGRYLVLLISVLFIIQNLAFLAGTFGELTWTKLIFFHLMPALVIISAIAVYLAPPIRENQNIIPRFFALIACFNIYTYATHVFA